MCIKQVIETVCGCSKIRFCSFICTFSRSQTNLSIVVCRNGRNLSFLSLRQVFFHFAGVKWSWEWFCDTLVVVIVNVYGSAFPSCIIKSCLSMSVFPSKMNKVHTTNIIISVANITTNSTWNSRSIFSNHSLHMSKVSMNISNHKCKNSIINFTIKLRHSCFASFFSINSFFIRRCAT